MSCFRVTRIPGIHISCDCAIAFWKIIEREHSFYEGMIFKHHYKVCNEKKTNNNFVTTDLNDKFMTFFFLRKTLKIWYLIILMVACLSAQVFWTTFDAWHLTCHIDFFTNPSSVSHITFILTPSPTNVWCHLVHKLFFIWIAKSVVSNESVLILLWKKYHNSNNIGNQKFLLQMCNKVCYQIYCDWFLKNSMSIKIEK